MRKMLCIGLFVTILAPISSYALCIGPSFGDEVKAAGLEALRFSVRPSDCAVQMDELTEAQKTAVQAVIAAHDPTQPSKVQQAEQAKGKARLDLITHCTAVEADMTQPIKLRTLCGLLKQALP